jgi:hypothetical protein
MKSLQNHGARAAGQANLLGHVGDGAYSCVFLLVAGDEQNLLLLTDVDRQRERHAREDDRIVDRN